MKKVIGILGRLIFILLFGFFLAFFVNETILSNNISISNMQIEIKLMMGSFLIMLIGFIISFSNAKLGGLLIILGGFFNIGILIYRGGIDWIIAAFIFGVTFLISGILIYFSHKKSNRYY